MTPLQQQVSRQVKQLVGQGTSVLLQAVCGAGKTELVMEAIRYTLTNGGHVGFAIARRQVVLEIVRRLQLAFSHLKVVAVCQGYTAVTRGDIIVCTTHQLFRYHNYFDLLIIDEPDAFPYKGNIVLQGLAQSSCRGQFIYLTATPDAPLLEKVRTGQLQPVYLNRRPFGNDLCVPKTVYGSQVKLLAAGVSWLAGQLKQNHKVMIFVPSRQTGRRLYRILSLFISCCHVDSTTVGKDKLIRQFKTDTYKVCVCTSVLERGVTISGVNVAVVYADHPVFDQAALVQMAGRVGRSQAAPEGDCLFLCRSRAEKIDGCCKSIVTANADG